MSRIIREEIIVAVHADGDRVHVITDAEHLTPGEARVFASHLIEAAAEAERGAAAEPAVHEAFQPLLDLAFGLHGAPRR